MLQERSKIILVAIVSFFLGWLFFWVRNKNKTAKVVTAPAIDENLNKTIIQEKEGKYFLVFNSVVELSREISREQLDAFMSKFPSGKSDGNVINEFSTVPNKYSSENGYYYESKWNGNSYGPKIQMTKEEYDFETKNSFKSEKIFS